MQEITTQNDFDYSLVDFETQEFLGSDYGKGFLTGIKIAVEIIAKQIPTPSEEDIGHDS
ncbi:TPA: hypothetical protein ACIOHY_000146 [Streptococcus agalactiae]|nr:hypothetical protein [Streptococcus agalactiae]HEO1312440.1 hypothetical protein [Streptococcus agalactiae]HEO4489405.1 hypothetical protein [Streptococcus agalactiae]HEO5647860.1 hypothetical protein [Streptococcus agalactiae]